MKELVTATKPEAAPEPAQPEADKEPEIGPKPDDMARKEPMFGAAGEAATAEQPFPAEKKPVVSDRDTPEAPTVVREFPTSEERRPERSKPRTKGRSRLLGLLIDNSANDVAEKAGPAPQDEEPALEQPMPEATTAAGSDAAADEPEDRPDASKVTEPGDRPEEQKAAELLEIPAFLRRQAN